MLTQVEADSLIASLKKLLLSKKLYKFPDPGGKSSLECKDGNNNRYIIDVARGRIKFNKVTYQTRYNKSLILIRVDIDGPPHDNPNGEEIPCPHIHIYREGYDDKWLILLTNILKRIRTI
jgi:hypothetical protein